MATEPAQESVDLAVSGATLRLVTDAAAAPSLEALVADVQAAIARLAAEATRSERSSGPVPGAMAALRGVESAVNTLGAARLTLVRVAKSQATRADLGGERSFSDWFARHTRQSKGGAAAQEQVAETLGALPAVQEAVTDGGLTLGHASVVAQVMGGASEKVREHLADQVEEIVAVGRAVSVPQLRKHLTAAVNALEADAADRSFHGARARRFLRLTSRSGGVAVEGFLDPLAGETLRTAIEAATSRPAADDDRTGEQRAADALVDLTSRILAVGLDKRGAQLRPQVTVLVREDTFLLLRWRRRLDGEGCSPATLTSDAFGRSGLSEPPPLAELLDGSTIPFAALDVLACDALFQRLVLDASGEPLDLGRTERTFVDGARQAVLIRDRHCQWPGCPMRAQWCEVHHLIRWADDGDTTSELGVTLCSNHHHRVHELGIRITKTAVGFTFAYRDGRSIGETSRVHDRLLVPARRVGGEGGVGVADGAGPAGATPAKSETAADPPDQPASGETRAGPDPGGSLSRSGSALMDLPGDSSAPINTGQRAPEYEFPEDCPARLW